MPILKDLKRHSKTYGTVEKGMVRLNFENEEIDVQFLKKDKADFSELRDDLNTEELEFEDDERASRLANKMYLDHQYYDIQKLLKNEMGEDKYNERAEKYLHSDLSIINNYIVRHRIQDNISHYNFGECRQEDEGEEKAIKSNPRWQSFRTETVPKEDETPVKEY